MKLSAWFLLLCRFLPNSTNISFYIYTRHFNEILAISTRKIQLLIRYVRNSSNSDRYSKYCHASASSYIKGLLNYGSTQQICQNFPRIQFFWNFDILFYDMNSFFNIKTSKEIYRHPLPPTLKMKNIHIINHIRKTGFFLKLFHIFVAIYKKTY